jgi:hypothetical protein
VRQAAKNALHASGPEPIGVKYFAAQIDPTRQAGVQLGEQGQIWSLRSLGFRISSFGFRTSACDGSEVYFRVPQQNLDQFGGRVTRPAQNSDFDHQRSSIKSINRFSTDPFLTVQGSRPFDYGTRSGAREPRT